MGLRGWEQPWGRPLSLLALPAVHEDPSIAPGGQPAMETPRPMSPLHQAQLAILLLLVYGSSRGPTAAWSVLRAPVSPAVCRATHVTETWMALCHWGQCRMGTQGGWAGAEGLAFFLLVLGAVCTQCNTCTGNGCGRQEQG